MKINGKVVLFGTLGLCLVMAMAYATSTTLTYGASGDDWGSLQFFNGTEATSLIMVKDAEGLGRTRFVGLGESAALVGGDDIANSNYEASVMVNRYGNGDVIVTLGGL